MQNCLYQFGFLYKFYSIYETIWGKEIPKRPHLIRLENLPSNDDAYKQLLEKYKKYLPELISVDLSKLASLRLINVYDYYDADHRIKSDSVNTTQQIIQTPPNQGTQNIDPTAILFNSMIRGLKALCPTHNTAEAYYEYLTSGLDAKLPPSIFNCLQTITKRNCTK